ncbi:hypothetical protein O3P69_005715 [Scylla paramamosain]|uniref:Uncharacterized protein n=1 Tax=Scylla paramamosain TaxID=85552 RepID=A0AAW0U961_SCYPA
MKRRQRLRQGVSELSAAGDRGKVGRSWGSNSRQRQVSRAGPSVGEACAGNRAGLSEAGEAAGIQEGCRFRGARRFLPESPRWLIFKGRHAEALSILKTAARVNKKSLPSEEVLFAAMRNIMQKTGIFPPYQLYPRLS